MHGYKNLMWWFLHKIYNAFNSVSYIAGKMMETLREKQPELGITEEEVLCVQIAGLCHDLGMHPTMHLACNRYLLASALHAIPLIHTF